MDEPEELEENFTTLIWNQPADNPQKSGKYTEHLQFITDQSHTQYTLCNHELGHAVDDYH